MSAGTGGRTQRSVDEHRAAVLTSVTALPTTNVPLADLAVGLPGRVLAADVRALACVPPFDAAAMDGYAVRLANLPGDDAEVTLPVVGDLRPGRPGVSSTPEGCERTAPGGAVRIMTGAPVPAWADAVVPVERTSTGSFVAGGPATELEVTLSRQPRAHVRYAGEDVRPGDLLAPGGSPVTPALVAVAASAGHASLPVRRRPLVAVLSTGSELVAPGTAGDGEIPDSNSLLLAACARAAGADVVRLGAVPDDTDALRRALDTAVSAISGASRDSISPQNARTAPGGGSDGRGVDLVVTTGGVSAGASDVVRAVLEDSSDDSGADELQDVQVVAVDLRPGRPQALARWHGVPWVALPGNPVSAFVSFALFARPALDVLAGRTLARPVRRRVAGSFASPPGRVHAVPVRLLGSGEVERATAPDGRCGGHMTAALLTADALALVAADVTKVEVGDEVDVLPLGSA